MFNSNNAFAIEIVLKILGEEKGSWFQLMDMTSGSLGKVVREVSSRSMAQRYRIYYPILWMIVIV